jgi:hypothetical protein
MGPAAQWAPAKATGSGSNQGRAAPPRRPFPLALRAGCRPRSPQALPLPWQQRWHAEILGDLGSYEVSRVGLLVRRRIFGTVPVGACNCWCSLNRIPEVLPKSARQASPAARHVGVQSFEIAVVQWFCLEDAYSPRATLIETPRECGRSTQRTAAGRVKNTLPFVTACLSAFRRWSCSPNVVGSPSRVGFGSISAQSGGWTFFTSDARFGSAANAAIPGRAQGAIPVADHLSARSGPTTLAIGVDFFDCVDATEAPPPHRRSTCHGRAPQGDDGISTLPLTAATMSLDATTDFLQTLISHLSRLCPPGPRQRPRYRNREALMSAHGTIDTRHPAD